MNKINKIIVEQLTIGCYMQTSGRVIIIDSIDNYGIFTTDGEEVPWELLEPIEITEEILLKTNHVKRVNDLKVGMIPNTRFILDKGRKSYTLFKYDNDKGYNFEPDNDGFRYKYIHQLQLAYLGMYGEQLKLDNIYGD